MNDLAAQEAAAAGAGRVVAAAVLDVLEHVRVEALLAGDGAGALDQLGIVHIRPSKDPQACVVEARACGFDGGGRKWGRDG